MVSEIVEILHELNIVDYNIYDEHRKAFEMYFVKHRLDMTRDKEVREIRLRVYRNFEEMIQNISETQMCTYIREWMGMR